MTCYIERNASPINDVTYDARDAAVAFCAGGRSIAWVDADTFRCMGINYTIVDRQNPKTARAAALEARPADYKAPTDKQITLINKLAGRIGGGSISVRVQMLREGRLDRRATSRLIDEMLTEARG